LLALPPVTDLRTLARALGVSEPTIRERARRGELEVMGIRVLRLGAQYRIPSEDILRVLGVSREGEGDDSAASPNIRQSAGATR
jgi:excisionase family DNA binding protein